MYIYDDVYTQIRMSCEVASALLSADNFLAEVTDICERVFRARVRTDARERFTVS